METARRVARSIEKQIAAPKKGETFELRYTTMGRILMDLQAKVKQKRTGITICKRAQGLYSKDHRGHDVGKRRLCTLSWSVICFLDRASS